MSGRIDRLPAGEQCCANTLIVRLSHFAAEHAVHCDSHALDDERKVTLWVQEMLIQAALGFHVACLDAGRPDDIESFKLCAAVAWHEATTRRKRPPLS